MFGCNVNIDVISINDMYISEDRLEVVVLTRCFTPFEALQRTDIMEEKCSFYMVAIS